MSQSPDSKSVLRRYVAALEAGDGQTVREMFAEDATWTLAAGELPISGVWHGRETILDEFLATALSYYESGSLSLEITGMIAENDAVVLQWTSRARTRDGRDYENDCIGVFTVREGQDPCRPRVHGHALRPRSNFRRRRPGGRLMPPTRRLELSYGARIPPATRRRTRAGNLRRPGRA